MHIRIRVQSQFHHEVRVGPDFYTLEVMCEPGDLVGYLKHKLYTTFGFNISYYKLFFNGVEIVDYLRLRDYGIMEGSRLDLIPWDVLQIDLPDENIPNRLYSMQNGY
jgi:hypothetical protein